MNCHGGDETGFFPGLIVKSVIPGPGGGSLTAHRLLQSGHGIPFAERFGGWHVTGAPGLAPHLGNLTGMLAQQKLTLLTNAPGQRFQWARYLTETSDILPHLLLEHQTGFINRAVAASYRVRSALHENPAGLTPAQLEMVSSQSEELVRYLLFADEVPLPPGAVQADSRAREDFLKGRLVDSRGLSLRDLDLKTRMLRHRCSYMIHSVSFQGLPRVLKDLVYAGLGRALKPGSGDPVSRHLPEEEKKAIRGILGATLRDLPAGW